MSWPIKSQCPAERLLKIQEILQDIANSTVSFAYDNVASLFGSGPQFFGRIVSRQGQAYCERIGFGATLTNFPVSTGPDYFEGHELLDLTLGISTLEPSGIIVDTGGVNNKQRFNFNIRRSLFASDEICANMSQFAVEELHELLSRTT
ncbi:unnamed protein product [Allacma fusca]|uniref:Uncharacterized protein n=1 Tax=Allacma fusca TaxID=39272 RepID=A0A8J2K5L2_9HEXA|nr:unnamed protein product [Allacma fusca]